MFFRIKSDERFEEPRGGVLHACARRQYIGMGERSVTSSRREIRDARKARHPQAALARDDGFGHGAHAHGIRPQPGERADLGGRFVARPAHGQINARPQRLLDLTARAAQERTEFLIVNAGQIDEALAALSECATQGVRAHQIDVIS